MRISLALPLLVILPVGACDDPAPITEDHPRQLAAAGDRVVVAASIETESTEFGCGGGDDPAFGPSVLFVSDDRGGHFDRVVPADPRPLTRLAVHDGVFYGLAQDPGGGFAVMSSADGRAWTEIAAGTALPHDLTASDASVVVAHELGVLTSPDGVTWTDHALGNPGLYAPSVARANETIAIGTASDGTLRLSADAIEWVDRAIPGLQFVWQMIPAGDAILVIGMADMTDGTRAAIGRVDLTNPESVPVFREALGDHAVLAPAGLLDSAGNLATVDVNGIGAGQAHVDPFTSGAVDGNLVAVLRTNQVAVSLDGGTAFSLGVDLPIVRTEGEPEEPCGDCGRPAP